MTTGSRRRGAQGRRTRRRERAEGTRWGRRRRGRRQPWRRSATRTGRGRVREGRRRWARLSWWERRVRCGERGGEWDRGDVETGERVREGPEGSRWCSSDPVRVVWCDAARLGWARRLMARFTKMQQVPKRKTQHRPVRLAYQPPVSSTFLSE
jgi:hypothetical protein